MCCPGKIAAGECPYRENSGRGKSRPGNVRDREKYVRGSNPTGKGKPGIVRPQNVRPQLLDRGLCVYRASHTSFNKLQNSAAICGHISILG